MCFRILISLLVPLMIIKIITHLPDCLWTWSLIFYRNSRKTSIRIKFYITCIQNILVWFSNSHVFISLYSLIILAWNSCLLSRNLSFQLFAHPIFLLFSWLINCLFIVVFLLLRGGRRRWWRWFSSNFNIIRWEKTFKLWSFDSITVPPSIFKCLLDKYLFTFLKGYVDWIISWLFLLSFLLFLLLLWFLSVEKFIITLDC